MNLKALLLRDLNFKQKFKENAVYPISKLPYCKFKFILEEIVKF